MPKAASKKSEPLVPAIVTEKELADAQKALKDEQTRSKARSSLRYHLASIGKLDAFNECNAPFKKQFFVKWFAAEMSSGVGSEVAQDAHKIVVTNQKDKTGVWWNKKKMIDEWGEPKALEKIEVLDQDESRHRLNVKELHKTT